MRLRWIVALLAIVGLGGLVGVVRAEDKKEENEVKVKFDALPAAVQATLKKESGNAKIDTVEKETEHGKTTYEADATIDGKAYEIKVAEDGQLISKKLDDDKDDDKDDKDDK